MRTKHAQFWFGISRQILFNEIYTNRCVQYTFILVLILTEKNTVNARRVTDRTSPLPTYFTSNNHEAYQRKIISQFLVTQPGIEPGTIG